MQTSTSFCWTNLTIRINWLQTWQCFTRPISKTRPSCEMTSRVRLGSKCSLKSLSVCAVWQWLFSIFKHSNNLYLYCTHQFAYPYTYAFSKMTNNIWMHMLWSWFSLLKLAGQKLWRHPSYWMSRTLQADIIPKF